MSNKDEELEKILKEIKDGKEDGNENSSEIPQKSEPVTELTLLIRCLCPIRNHQALLCLNRNPKIFPLAIGRIITVMIMRITVAIC